MKNEFLYLIVDHDGTSRKLAGPADSPADPDAALAQGWRPIREASFGSAGAILILFEKEPDPEQFGFGFSSK